MSASEDKYTGFILIVNSYKSGIISTVDLVLASSGANVIKLFTAVSYDFS
jgi:hypothetical protein